MAVRRLLRASSARGGKSDDQLGRSLSDDDLDTTNWTSGGVESAASAEAASTEAAIEARWNAEAVRVEKQEELEAVRADLKGLHEKYSQSIKELKATQARAERLANENRVLRREQRGGRRDEVILQLETELACKEQERADMEENLPQAFGSVIADAQGRISKLTAERDRLLISLEEARTGKSVVRK